MSRKVHVQYRGKAAYIDRDDPAEYAAWLGRVDFEQDSNAPRINDFVKVHKYAGTQDDTGRITYKRTADDGESEYCISSGNMPFCGSIDEWLRRDDFTILPRG